ncbi:2OG-Fe(II) oxygenase [Rhodococcus sp. ACPA4]|uniref:isopenicillin N synthase family dioxygenase n=1 Tax=Rhodococcus sp. ACPA4 TaxID=2028571 RepID=UPI000BB127A7|nr:2-oxoglutarate and iron-dependent oxygenase domain-containing protein [Rhodococcus sp. ACPA4]PBC37568.1 2OG-Fe(II) oxygenase [Rhodococcus sp. ACPA4]
MAFARNAGTDFQVPIIDISTFTGGADIDRQSIARQVDLAASTVGFMQVVGHGIQPKVLDRFTAATDEFFALPESTKRKYSTPPHINRGYTPPRAEALANSLGIITAADLFEAFNIGVDPADHASPDLDPVDYAPTIFPGETTDFESAVTAWFGEARRVAHTMADIFALALHLPIDYFRQFTTHSLDVLRINNYQLPHPDVTLESEQMGMGAHTDYGIVTVLWADQVPGLEILDSQRVWHPVQPADGALLVNLGDALARWTNDRWISTMHRVAPPRVDGRLVPRRSAAFFHDGNPETVIACLPGCTGPGNPPRYEPVTVKEHITAKLRGSRGREPNPHAIREAARLTGSTS